MANNEGKSVVAQRFIRSLRDKIKKKMKANESKFFLSYLNSLADEYNNTCHRSVRKKPIDADYSVLTEEIKSIHNPFTPRKHWCSISLNACNP